MFLSLCVVFDKLCQSHLCLTLSIAVFMFLFLPQSGLLYVLFYFLKLFVFFAFTNISQINT